jgi:phage-related protein
VALGGYDGTIRIDSRIDEKGFNKGIKSMTASLKGLAVAMGAAFGVAAAFLFGKKAVDAASDLASAMTGLQSVLTGTGKSFSEAKAFIDDYIRDGLIPATDAITAYKNLALRGYDTTQINKTLIALKDAAAFGRQSSLSLGGAVASATEGLKNENSILVDNAGVTKNVAKMWEDYAKSIGTSVTSLTKQQKIQAEVNGILQETRFQTGDAAKLTHGYAGLVASLGTSFYNLKVAVGNVLIPVLSAIIPVLKTVIDYFVIAFNQIGQFVSALFGIKPAADQAGAGADQLADSTEKAEKAAKGALAAFDKIDVLQSDTQQPAAAAIGLDTAPVDAALTDTENKFKDFADRLKDKLRPIAEALSNVLAAGINVVTAALDALKPLGEWLWNNFLEPLADWAYQALLDGLKWLADRLNDLADWIDNHQTAFQTIVIILGSFAAAWFLVNAAIGIFTAVGAAAAVVMAVLTSPILLVVLAIGALIAVIILLYKNWDDVKRIAGQVWDKIKEIWGRAADWFNRNVLEPLGRWFSGAWDDILGSASATWTDIQGLWTVVSTWFMGTVIDPLKRFFADAWDAIKKFPSNAWDFITNIWRGAGPWFQNTVIDPIKNGFNVALNWIKNRWETIFTGIKTFLRNQINGIIGFLNGMIGAITSALNAVIGALNSIHVSIPGFSIPYGPSFGGYSFGVNLPYLYPPRIPYLAQGAVIPPNAQFAAILGDQRSGRNLETPEALLRQIVREESGGGAQEITIRFEGTLSELVRQLKPHIDRENKRVGGALIKGVTP